MDGLRTNTSLAVKKFHVHFNSISFQEIFIERLLPDDGARTPGAHMSGCLRRETVDPDPGRYTKQTPPRYLKKVDI